MNVIVIGAGIFGVSVSLILSENGYNVTLVESEKEIMSQASKCNHNRIHFGFHYPRSIETAKQSLYGYDLFYKNFSDSIITDFPNYYMIEKNSKVSYSDFKSFCDELNLNYKECNPSNININMENIELSLLTNEPIFDFESIKKNLKKRLQTSKVNLFFNKKIITLSQLDNFDVVINTTYRNINQINNLFQIEPIKLKLQDVIVPIFKMKHDKIGLTIMDGQFCSIMPKGFDKNTFLLYHVKYSVINHLEGYVIPENWVINDSKWINNRIKEIYNQSSLYYLFLKNCEKKSYWRTIRALPINEDDERLSKLTVNKINNKIIISLLSGKITTCWLMSKNILEILNENTFDR